MLFLEKDYVSLGGLGLKPEKKGQYYFDFWEVFHGYWGD